jgi:hypothetical protein
MHADTGKDDEVERLQFANGIVAAIPGLKTCYGGFNGKDSVRGIAYIEALSSAAMGLNLSKKISNDNPSTEETRYLYSSDRIAHFMGNGCLTFTQRGFGLEEIYASDEVAFFDGLADLTEQVREFVKNPAARQKIAKKGWAKVHQEFNGTVVMNYVIERLMQRSLSRAYAWPTEGYGPERPAAVDGKKRQGLKA